jgi:hypothetical protein
MIRILIFLFAIVCLIQFGCKSSSASLTSEKIVNDYINGLNESNFEHFESFISDSLTTMEGGFVLTENSKDYYIHFQWDSVFSPKYNIINSKKISDNSVEVTLSKTCKRIKYLHDTATIYKVRFDFANNHIIKIDNFELVYFDTLKWSSRRDALVAWIKIHYPDLDGFVYDQTLIGAQNYLKAIELYNDKKNRY